jgi:ribosomal protein S3AE
MSPSILKRLIRKNKRKIDDSFIATTNDGTLVKVKPMILTNYIVPKDVRRSIRLLTRYYILDLVAKGNYDDFINAILSTDIQRALKAKLDKVSPISVVLVRAFNKIYKPRTKDLRVAKSYAEFLESEKEFYDKALSDTSVKQRKEKKPKILSESEKPKDYDEELVSVNIE